MLQYLALIPAINIECLLEWLAIISHSKVPDSHRKGVGERKGEGRGRGRGEEGGGERKGEGRERRMGRMGRRGRGGGGGGGGEGEGGGRKSRKESSPVELAQILHLFPTTTRKKKTLSFPFTIQSSFAMRPGARAGVHMFTITPCIRSCIVPWCIGSCYTGHAGVQHVYCYRVMLYWPCRCTTCVLYRVMLYWPCRCTTCVLYRVMLYRPCRCTT